FNGTNSYILVPYSPLLDPAAESFTIEAWVRTTNGSGEIVSKYAMGGLGSGGSSDFELGIGQALGIPDDLPGFYVRGQGVPGQLVIGPNSIGDGQFHHIVAGRDVANGTIFLYVDGLGYSVNLAGGGSIFGDGETAPLLIGASDWCCGQSVGDHDSFFHGTIDEVSYYSRALSSNEIAALYQRRSGIPGTCFDAWSDFTASGNPNGAWSYAWSDSRGSALRFYTNSSIGTDLDGWSRLGAFPFYHPLIYFNKTGLPIQHDPDTIYPPDALTLTAGPSGVYGVIRFTAPANGLYFINGHYDGLTQSCPATSDVWVLLNSNTTLWNGNITSAGQRLTFHLAQTLAAGDRIDFTHGDGGEGLFCDTIGFRATLSTTSLISQAPPIIVQQPHSRDCIERHPVKLSVAFQRGEHARGNQRHDLANEPFAESIRCIFGRDQQCLWQRDQRRRQANDQLHIAEWPSGVRECDCHKFRSGGNRRLSQRRDLLYAGWGLSGYWAVVLWAIYVEQLRGAARDWLQRRLFGFRRSACSKHHRRPWTDDYRSAGKPNAARWPGGGLFGSGSRRASVVSMVFERELDSRRDVAFVCHAACSGGKLQRRSE
ncbi:MAG: hypothetical protein DMG78_32920, partial [Acidobacteria bacterium]